MLLHTSRPKFDCLVVRLKFSPNHETPPYKHFIQLENDPLIETASFSSVTTIRRDPTGTREINTCAAKLAGQRRCFIFFEVNYRVYKDMDDGSLLIVEDTRRERAELLLLGREQPWGFYTDEDLRNLFQSLMLLTIPPIPSFPSPFSSPYTPSVNL